MFEKASRMKLRFEAPNGLLGTEDLWGLPLKSSRPNQTNLDDIARGLHQRIKNQEDISFVDDAKAADTETQLKFDIVRHVISVKKAEAAAAQEAKKNADLKQRVLEIKAKRADAALEGKSDDELDKLLATL